MPSEFGHYEAKEKYIKEFERIDKIRAGNIVRNRKIIISTGSSSQRQSRSASQKVL